MKNVFLRAITMCVIITCLVSISSGCGSGTWNELDEDGLPQAPPPAELGKTGFLYPELPRMTGEQLKHRIDNGVPLVVVDTRLRMFFNAGHIPNSVNIIYYPDLWADAELLALPKDRLIIFQCD